MKIVFNCIVLLSLTACSVTNGWKSNDVPGRIDGSFFYLNGKQNLGISVPKGKSLLKYHLKSSAGELHLIISSPEKVIVKVTTGKELADSMLLDLNKSLRYKVTLIGKKAQDSYDIECFATTGNNTR